MKSLQIIQKTFRVFQILAKIAFVFSIVGASLCAVGALCAMTWYNGGQVFSLFGQPIAAFAAGENLQQAYAVLLSDVVYLSTNAVLLAFAGQYFKAEQADGTPFTERGANHIRKLGIRCIWMPIVAVVIASVITVCLGVEQSGDVSNLPSVITGIVLILASLIFRYGAELEEQNRFLISDRGKKDTIESRNMENL